MPSKRAAGKGAVRIALLGDIVGQPGRDAIREFLPELRAAQSPHLVIGNAENAAGGKGLTPPVIDDLLDLGVDVLTSGNHIWSKKDIIPEFSTRPYLLRPANYPPGAPGHGYCVTKAGDAAVAVLNLMGRVFMNPVDCPFQVGNRLVEELRAQTPVIVVDMHAEATSEKQAMGWYLDGRVSAVIGTHTHVLTADARILPGGTAYLSDAGMTGPSESVLGMKKEVIVERFLTQVPQKFEVARLHPQMEGAVVDIDASTGLASSIETFRYGGPQAGQPPLA